MKADKPFQALAATFALHDHDAACHLPVAVDGSNNGLQHYAAMLRCPVTAKLVNLLPADEPSDVYRVVMARAIQIVAGDCEGTIPPRPADFETSNAARTAWIKAGGYIEYARQLEGWITRKVAKRPTMTYVYGVRHSGARKQVAECFRDAGFPADSLYPASNYFARVALNSAGQVCIAARRAMEWIRACAKLIAAANKEVCWETPLGFEVIQPYRNSKRHQVLTLQQVFRVNVCRRTLPVSPRRQMSGAAPNFVHSLDATHMAMTAIRCDKEEIAFAAVHDSYVTHAGTMPNVAVILREEFVKLHAKPAHIDLYEQFCKRYPKIEFPAPPECGTLNLNRVLEAEYFFG